MACRECPGDHRRRGDLDPGVDAIFSHNDEMVRGVLAGCVKSGKSAKAGEPGHIVIVGIDGTPLAFKRIRSGEQDATVQQDPFEMGALAIRPALSAINGEKSPPEQLSPPTLVTKANVDDPKRSGATTSSPNAGARRPPYAGLYFLRLHSERTSGRQARIVQVGARRMGLELDGHHQGFAALGARLRRRDRRRQGRERAAAHTGLAPKQMHHQLGLGRLGERSRGSARSWFRRRLMRRSTSKQRAWASTASWRSRSPIR